MPRLVEVRFSSNPEPSPDVMIVEGSVRVYRLL
jgi:hypothetical protein